MNNHLVAPTALHSNAGFLPALRDLKFLRRSPFGRASLLVSVCRRQAQEAIYCFFETCISSTINHTLA